MKAFVYAGPTRNAGDAIFDLARLWEAGLLTDDSTVWINTTSSEPLLWALTGARSTLIYLHRCVDPGYVRLTAGRARWARTHDGTRDQPPLDVNFADLPGDHEEAHTTLVIAHRGAPPRSRVGVIDKSVRHGMSAGSYTHGAVTVVDLPAYRAAHYDRLGVPDVAVSQFVTANAAYNGLKLLAHGLSDDDAALVRQYPEAFEFDIAHDALTAACQYLSAIDTYAATFQPMIAHRLGQLTADNR